MGHEDARRAARLLAVSWAVAWIGVPISGGFGSVIVRRLSDGDLALTGVPFFLVYLGSLVIAYPAGRLMDRFGRKPILIGGHLTTAVGFGLGTLAILAGNLWAFFGAQLVGAMGSATSYLTRLAAADLYPPAERARGLGRLVFLLVFGALLGLPVTQLAIYIDARTEFDVLVLAWATIPVLALTAAFLVSRIRRDPKDIAHEIQPAEATPTGPRTSNVRAILAAGGTLLFAQAAMASPMSVSGAALDHAGHGADVISLTLALHIVGMFGFSPLIGRIGDRWGRRPLLWSAGAYLLPGTAIVYWKPEGSVLLVALVLIGIGWSFAFIGSTSLIADVVSVAHRGRVTGAIDSATAIIGGFGSLAAGWALNGSGLAAVGALGAAFAFACLLVSLAAPRAQRRTPIVPPVPNGFANDLSGDRR